MTDGPVSLESSALAALAPSRIARTGPTEAAGSPACPICSASTVRRTVRSGPRVGIDIWGCTNSPRCRGTLDLGGTFGRVASGHGVGVADAMDPRQVALDALLGMRDRSASVEMTADGLLRPSRSTAG